MEPEVEAGLHHAAHDRVPPLAAVLSRLFGDAETLLLQELALFRSELGENAGRMLGGTLVCLAGLGAIIIGALGVVAAATVLLSDVLPLWLACALIGLVVAATGALIMLYGRQLIRRTSFVPRQTRRSLRETGDWIREELA